MPTINRNELLAVILLVLLVGSVSTSTGILSSNVQISNYGTLVLPSYNLSVDTVGSGSVSLDKNGPYAPGEVVELTASANSGWSFSGWSGDLSGSSNPETIVMNSNKDVTATFIEIPPASLLHTDGQYIMDANDNIVYLRGVDKTDFLTDPTGYFSHSSGIGVWSQSAMQQDVDKMASHGFNLVRVLINMDWFLTNSRNTWNGPNTADRGFVDCLEDYIAYCQTKGVYVLLVPWQIRGASGSGGSGQTGGETDPWGYSPIDTVSDFVDWWGTVSTTLAQYPNMLYDLWNEYHGSYNSWLGPNAAVAQATARIRTVTDAPVVVQMGYAGGVGWVPDEWDWLGPLGNIVISQHIYRMSTFSGYQSSTSQSQVASVLENVWDYDAVLGRYPFVCGELGAYIGGVWGDDGAERAWHQSVLAYLNSYGASYAEWIWDMQYGGAYAVQNSQRGSLTWAGQNLVNAIAAG